MSEHAVPLPAAPLLPVTGSALPFPVGRVICIGRNYADHAREMGHDPDREPPFFFFKYAGAVTTAPVLPYPPLTADLHHEVEMVVALGQGGADIAIADAEQLIFGYGVGIDFTRRDLQNEAKSLGRPWETGKSFDFSAPCGPLTRAAEIGHPARGAISLAVNGTTRQSGDLNQMIWSTPEMIAILSRSFALQPGDLIMTGTPAGVGAVAVGDRIAARIEGLPPLDLVIGPKA